jgi:ligand-binding sensor domain-containing protein
MNKHYLQILFLLIILTGCKKEQEAPQETHPISRISWTTYDKNNSGLQDNFIVSVEIDKSDNIWIGTFSNGIAKFDQSKWYVYNTQNSGLSNDSIWDMAFDNQNVLWIATKNGLTKFDGTNWTIYNRENANLPVKFISAVAVDMDNIIWLGCGSSEEGGLMKYDGTNWELFTPENSSLPCRIISKIYVDKSNNKWIATWPYQSKGGVVKIEGDNWTVFNMDNTIIPYNMADDITEDPDGNIWVAITALFYDEYGVFEGSLLRYDGNNWKEFKPHDYIPKLTNRITCLKADMNNNIWITTMPESMEPQKYEIAMFNGTEWYVISDIDSTFPHDYVEDMEFDKNNNLWIGHTGLGLTKLMLK